ncbi:hypothetical protein Sgleb_13460 [Streptomyces glebosus]|uniref:Uncharacterized protein n=1 Tax=Streptomyces glebosus TaxID=249580 RepID=A0A640SPG2_9ACTN|nr:helix-turn-helix domain-containing protein [Streptomyces glebosus]GFE13299.1 hypothetical protein Sgleb_13460 [Streptomyces glebosus]GHG66571.1 hypothetical protein GCM10010513_35850 [Streptomyces glebosus]
MEDASQALGFSRAKGYDLVRRGDFPCRVLRIGRSTRVVTASLLRVLESGEPELEAPDARGKAAHKLVQVGVGYRVVDPSVAFGEFGNEVGGRQHGFKCSAPAPQTVRCWMAPAPGGMPMPTSGWPRTAFAYSSDAPLDSSPCALVRHTFRRNCQDSWSSSS